MSNVIKNVLFKNHVVLFIHKILYNRLSVSLILSSLFTLQICSTGYATQQFYGSIEQKSFRKSLAQSREKEMNNVSELDSISYEKGEIISLLPVREERKKSWKQNWLVKNVILEMPIIGDFFHDDLSVLDSIMRAGRTTSMLLGGSAGMMMDFIPMSGNHSMVTHIPKDTFNMAIGMWVGVVSYNTVLALSSIILCERMPQ